MAHKNSTVDKTFDEEDLHLLVGAIDIIRRVSADTIANALGKVSRQGQQKRTKKVIKMIEKKGQ